VRVIVFPGPADGFDLSYYERALAGL